MFLFGYWYKIYKRLSFKIVVALDTLLSQNVYISHSTFDQRGLCLVVYVVDCNAKSMNLP